MIVAMGEWGPHSHKHKLNMADFILNMPLRLFARVFGNPAGDPVLLKSRGVTLLRDNDKSPALKVIVRKPVQTPFLWLSIVSSNLSYATIWMALLHHGGIL